MAFSNFLAPSRTPAPNELPGIFRRVQEALDRISRSGFVQGLFTRDITPACPSITRVSPPSAGMRAVMPAASADNAGQSVKFLIENPQGNLVVHAAPNQTVAGASTAVYNVAGLVELTSNGTNGWFLQAQTPVGGAGASPWQDVLAVGANSGANTPIIDSGQALNFASGATGITADGDLTVASVGDTHVHPSGALHLGHTGITDNVHVEAGAEIELAALANVQITAATHAYISATDEILLQPGTFVGIPTGYLEIGAVGPTAGNPQIRCGDALFRIRATNGISLGGGASSSLFCTAGDLILAADASAVVLQTALTNRLVINSTGEWIVPAGSSGKFFKHNGAASPIWANLALADLPSQAADTFLGRLAGAGTPTAQLLSDIDSTSIIYDATSHTFQLAAGTGDVTWSQNTTATTIAANAVSNTKLRDSGALSVIGRSSNSSGDPADISATAASGAVLRESGSTIGFGQVATAGIANDAVDNTKLANMASPRLKGRTTASTGDPEDLTLTNSTSVTWNTATGGAISVERAALTGEATASANANAVTVTRSTNFQSSPWTGQHQHNANVYYSGAFIGLDTKATVDAMSTGDIRKGGALVISSNSTVEIDAGSGLGLLLTTASGGQGWLRMGEGVVQPTLAAGQGGYWVRGSSSLVNFPMYTDDTANDHELAYILDDDDKSARTMARVVFWDDFLTGFGVTSPAAGNTYFHSDTAWLCESSGTAGSVAIHDSGATGPGSSDVGRIDLTTAAVNGATVVLYKGAATTTRWIRASSIRSLKVRAGITSTSSVAFALGFADTVYGGGDAAYFYFDTALDTTIHAFSANSGGATSNDTDTNIAPGTGYREYEIREAAANSLQWEFLIDGSVVATHTMTSKARGLNLHLLAIARSASARTLFVDYVSLEGNAQR